MEYVEVIQPIIYSKVHQHLLGRTVLISVSVGLHRLVLFQMHNGAYNLSLTGYTNDQVYSSILNVLAYSLPELVSFVASTLILDNLLGFSLLRQLCFVLERHASIVQAKLTVVFLYVMQVPLMHLGLDFSFKFTWLQQQ
eukprot:jgi/Phyca11/102415/e_gw1.6.1057.1